jgi:argininosuccinate synthase
VLQRVSGSVDISLFKGKASIVGRSSPLSLYNQHIASMDAQGAWNPADSTGFIRINSVRLRAHYHRENAIASGKVKA